MKKQLTFLGIETSCDETAASIVREKSNGRGKILSNIVSSQFDIHKKFGGVVPELAARSHVEKIDLITNEALKKSGLKINDIDAVAVTAGPGLIVCLTVGLNFGKAFAMSSNKPLPPMSDKRSFWFKSPAVVIFFITISSIPNSEDISKILFLALWA